MRMMRTNGRLGLAWPALGLCVLLLASCATTGERIPQNPMALLSSGADAYACIPVEGNRLFVEQMLASFGFEDLSEQALSRIHSVYISIRFSEGEGTKSIIEGFALGSFPKAASGLIFPASKGWLKQTERGAGEWYSLNGLRGAVPRSGVLLFSSEGDIASLLRRLKSGGGDDAPVLPPRFESAVLNATSGIGSLTGFFVQNPKQPLSRFLGPDLTLPIASAEAYIERDGTDNALFSVYLETTDARSARMAASLFRLALGAPFTQDGSTLSLENRSFPVGTLADAIKKMYF